MSLSHIANQLNSLHVSGTPALNTPTGGKAVNAVLRQAMEQHIPTGRPKTAVLSNVAFLTFSYGLR